MYFSVKKLVTISCIIAVSSVSIVFATLGFSNMLFNNTTVIGTGESTADKVTIYGNGVTFINYERVIQLESDNNTVRFHLPYGALIDTLRVSGIDVVKIITSEETHPIIERGDIITVYTEDSVYTGKFLGWDNMLLLEANNGTIMIPGGQITKIVLTEVVQTQGPKILVEVTTDSPSGQYQLGISYLMRGPRWKPTYFIDLETAYLECWATIENVENWKNFTMVLVSGGPHIIYQGPILQPYITSVQEGARESPSIDFTSTTVDEYHEYTYSEKLSFEKDKVVRLPLFNGTVNLRQEYFWSSGKVQNRYHIKNTLNEPLAAGVAEFYRGQTWVGEDTISYVPVKGEGIAIVNYAYDIKVTSEVTKTVDEYNKQVRGITITIRNHKSASIQVLIQQNINGYTLVVSTTPATRVGPNLSWIVNVDVDGKETICYEWKHSW